MNNPPPPATKESGNTRKSASAQKTRVHNHLFSDEYRYVGGCVVETKILLTQYNGDVLEWHKLEPDTKSFKSLFKEGCVNWIDVVGLNDSELIKRLIAEFEFPAIDAKAILTPYHASKIEDIGGRLFIVCNPCFFDKKDRITTEHACILSKGSILITFRERGELSFDNVMRALNHNIMRIREKGRGMLIAFLLNEKLSTMIGTALKVEDMLGEIDDILLETSQTDAIIGKKIHRCSQANLILQKNAGPLKKEFTKLPDMALFRDDTDLLQALNELYSQLGFIVGTTRNSTELLNSLRDLYVSNNDLRMNVIMKRLTVVATLFIPITFLVGLWGMNFKYMPETQWKYGYAFALAVIAVTAFASWLYMKKHKWF